MLITNRSEFDEMLRAIGTSETIAFDTEGTGLELYHGDAAVGISVYCTSNDQTYYFPFGHGISATAKPNKAIKFYEEHLKSGVLAENMPREWLQELIAIWNTPKLHIAHNAAFDLTALDHLGFPMPDRIADTMVMLGVVNSDWLGVPKKGIVPKFYMPDTKKYESGNRTLKWQARLWGIEAATSGIDGLTAAYESLQAEINAGIGKSTRLTTKKKGAAQSFIWAMAPSAVAHYAEEDTRLTYLLYQKIMAHAVKWDDFDVLDLYNEAALAAWVMHKNGMRLDVERAAGIVERTNRTVYDLTAEVASLTGGLVKSVNAPKQVVGYLNAIGIDAVKANKEVLTPLEHLPAVKAILKARALSKRVGSFVGKWYQNHVNGFLHFTFNIGAAGTGRATSADKKFNNAQNLPRSSEKVAINPKEYVMPPEGTILVEFDYSGMEMTLAAFIAETVLKLDPNYTLTRIAESGADIHGRTMEMSGLYDMILDGLTEAEWLEENGYRMKEGVDPAAYFRKQIARQRAKTGGFAVLYGGGVRGVSTGVGCTEEQAAAIIRGFHKAYPAMRPALEHFETLALTPRALPSDPQAKGQYIKYPLPKLQLKRKYHFYPTRAFVKDRYGETREINPMKRMARGAFNSEIQGTGAMIMYKSIVRCFRELGFADYHLTENGKRVYHWSKGKIVAMGTVHDSFVIALRPQDLAIVKDIYRIMTDYPVRPKLQVDVSAALVDGSWSSVKHVEDLDRWIDSGGSWRNSKDE